MCGMMAEFRRDGQNIDKKRLVERYEDQKYRGQKGFGFITWMNGVLNNYVRTTVESELFLELGETREAQGIMLHHRFPTSTLNESESAHPIMGETDKNTYFLIHNGIISNAKEIREKWEELGVKFNTKDSKGAYNDSESLLWELINAIEEDKWEEIKAEGSYAFILAITDKKTVEIKSIVFGTNGKNPLFMNLNKKVLELGSEDYEVKFKEAEPRTLYEFIIKENKVYKIANKIPLVEKKVYYMRELITETERDKRIEETKKNKKTAWREWKDRRKNLIENYNCLDDDLDDYCDGIYGNKVTITDIDTTDIDKEEENEIWRQIHLEEKQELAEKQSEIWKYIKRVWDKETGKVIELSLQNPNIKIGEVIKVYKKEKDCYKEIYKGRNWKKKFKEDYGNKWKTLLTTMQVQNEANKEQKLLLTQPKNGYNKGRRN
jgi:hypothetical protein